MNNAKLKKWGDVGTIGFNPTLHQKSYTGNSVILNAVQP